jgi:tetratricopeptide (TPR) repeat protein
VRIVSILLGALSFLIPFIVFFKTMAPTLSFWDCGEFIACAHTLGVPHPPGTPFFVIFGKFFILLSPFDNIALRTNFISVISSAFTAFMAYLVVIRVTQKLPFAGEDTPWLGQIGIRIGAFAGAMILAFSSTFWFNAVETEVYGLAMLLMVLMIYLAIKWADEKEVGGSDKLVIMITFLLFLSIGVHLTVFLVVPAFFLYFVLVDRTKLRDAMFWITWAILFSIAVPVYFFLNMTIPWFEDNSYWIWIFLMFAGLVYSGVMAFTKARLGRMKSANYHLAFALFAAAILGYSSHLYIPIRASQDPAINENDPSSLSRFESYLERKQYGQESMISRMFYRRAKLENQFGRHENMGFGGYFMDQYASTHINKFSNDDVWDAWGFLPWIVFGLGAFGLLVGAYHALKKFKFHPILLLFMLFFISSVLLILYLNFSDGTRPDPNNPGELITLEVRERDYFFTPAFVVFAIIVGAGMASLMHLLGNGVRFGKDGGKNWLKYLIFGAVGVALLLMPLNPAFAHYKLHNRAKDYAPADYAYNILKSCKPSAIIFTNGDNDTFPLWYLQEVERVRNDVRVVNLSLLNTDWYILQLKHQMGIKMALEDNQITWVPAGRRGPIVYYRPVEKFYDKVRKQWRFLTAEQDPRTGQVIRVQDQMIEQIVISNLDDVPIYFSGSVPTSNRWTLSDRLIRQGIVLEVDPDTTKPGLNMTMTDSLITDVYRYTGMNDLEAFKDENNVGLTTTFPERFSELAIAYASAGDTTRALEILWDSIDKLPHYHQTYIDLQTIYLAQGNTAMVDSVKTLGINNLKAACDAWPMIILYHQFLGVLYFQNNMLDEALDRYRIAYELQPNNAIAFRLYRDLSYHMKKFDLARDLMMDWTGRHPEDLEIRNQLSRMPR